MDATSIITQVSRDDEQLNAYPNDKGMSTKRYYIHILVFLRLKTKIKPYKKLTENH